MKGLLAFALVITSLTGVVQGVSLVGSAGILIGGYNEPPVCGVHFGMEIPSTVVGITNGGHSEPTTTGLAVKKGSHNAPLTSG